MTYNGLRKLRWILYLIIGLCYGGWLLMQHFLQIYHNKQDMKQFWAEQTALVQSPDVNDYYYSRVENNNSRWLKVCYHDANEIWLLVPQEESTSEYKEGETAETVRVDFFHNPANKMDTLHFKKAELLAAIGPEQPVVAALNSTRFIGGMQQCIRLDGPIFRTYHSSRNSATGPLAATFRNGGISGKILAIEPIKGEVALKENYIFKAPFTLPLDFKATDEISFSFVPQNKEVVFRLITASAYSPRMVWLIKMIGSETSISRENTTAEI